MEQLPLNGIQKTFLTRLRKLIFNGPKMMQIYLNC